MRWIPIVHDDGVTVGVARFDGDVPIDVHWVGTSRDPVTPERWQRLLAVLVPDHRGSGEGWMIRAAQEGVRGLAGTAFDEVRVEGPDAPPADPEAAKLVERTLAVERTLLERILELEVAYASVDALAAAVERTLSEYDRAVLATAIDEADLPRWCRAVATKWWESEGRVRK